MTYGEATKIMTEGARSVTPLEFIEGSIGNIWFWTNTLKMWVAMFFISFISYFLTERWNANKCANKSFVRDSRRKTASRLTTQSLGLYKHEGIVLSCAFNYFARL